MNKILFAITNTNKVNRLRNLLNEVDIEIMSLSELDYQINEPEEVGNDPIEIATNKANYYWQNLRKKMPVLAQDDTLEFFDIPEMNVPRLSIKQPVIDKFGVYNDGNAIEYYTGLAAKYGERIDMRFNYGFALNHKNITKSKGAQLNCTLVDQVSKIINPGYFLTAIIKVSVDGIEIFYSELTPNQQKVADDELAGAVKYLISDLI